MFSTEKRPEIPAEGLSLEAVTEVMRGPIDAAMHVRWHVAGIAGFKGARAPTYEEIGRVLAFVTNIEQRIEELRGYVEDIRGYLPELIFVAELENVPEDPDEDEDDDDVTPESRKALRRRPPDAACAGL